MIQAEAERIVWNEPTVIAYKIDCFGAGRDRHLGFIGTGTSEATGNASPIIFAMPLASLDSVLQVSKIPDEARARFLGTEALPTFEKHIRNCELFSPFVDSGFLRLDPSAVLDQLWLLNPTMNSNKKNLLWC